MTGVVAPRGDDGRRGASKPTATANRWRVIDPDDDDDYEPNNKVKDPADDSLNSGQHKKANIVDGRKEYGRASKNGHTFTCPEPGNAGQHVNCVVPKSLGENGAGKMPAPKRSLS